MCRVHDVHHMHLCMESRGSADVVGKHRVWNLKTRNLMISTGYACTQSQGLVISYDFTSLVIAIRETYASEINSISFLSLYPDEIMSRLLCYKLQLLTLDIESKESASNLHMVHSFCLKQLLVTTRRSADCLAKHNVLKCKMCILRNHNVLLSVRKLIFFNLIFLYMFSL